MPALVGPQVPFRWDLITPDHLGTLLDGVDRPDLWFAGDLLECAGKVLARSGDGDLFFVGRSLDSMFDVLGGALAGTSWSSRLHRLPVSFAIPGRLVHGRWHPDRISHAQHEQAKRNLGALGLSPRALARRDRPVTFVDVVHSGSTFTKLFSLLRDWVEIEREPWSVIRRKVRFVGVTSRTKTSPHTHRWQQHAAWTRELPARSVLNVSLDRFVWSYLGDRQIKLTRTFRPQAWLADADGPGHGERTRQALAEAVALVEHGRTAGVRKALALAMSTDPSIAQAWLRTLIGQLNAGTSRG
ncbi:MAG TPA: hypothetical protein VF062_02460 [Candidatus Limnocylindrales bacterium]